MAAAAGPVRLRPGFQSKGLRPNRFNSEQFAERILSQGEINMDCSVDPRLGTQRREAVTKLPRDQVFGHDLGENFENVDLHMGEPALMYKSMITSNGMEKFFPKKAHIFTSLNGMYILGKNKKMTQSDFEDQFMFAGISNGDVTFGMNKESSMKVSTRIAGSGTLENTGNDEFNIGDDIVWSLNSIHESERAQELMELPEVQYKKKEKMGIVWRRLNYREAVYYLQDSLTLTFDRQYDDIVNDFTILTDVDKSHHVKDNIRVGMLMRALVAFASWNGIVNAIERGWVVPRSPADFKRDSFDTNYTDPSWEAIDSIDPVDLSRGMVVEGPNRALKFLPAETVKDEDLREQTRFKQFLAAKHGFFGDVYGRGVQGSHAFLDTITCRTLRGMITSKKEYDAGDISHVFRADPEEGPTGMFGTSKLNHHHNLQALIGHLLALQGRIGNDLYATAVHSRNKQNTKVVAKCLTHSLPGEKWDYLLKIH